MAEEREPLIIFAGAIGLDEAGRGPLAGPVTAAAVILDDGFDVSGLDDSKRLTPAQRQAQAVRLRSCCHAVISVEPAVIDEINILWASMRAMELALAALGVVEGAIFVDGDRVPRALAGRAEAVIGGDGKYACIAAASILAKTTRDALMCDYAAVYPGYGFERHFGYATPEHFAALKELGPCPIHRRSFAPVGQLQPALFETADA